MSESAVANKAKEAQLISIKDIGVAEHVLRKVNKKSKGFLQLKDSIKDKGLLNPISVRPNPSRDDERPQAYLLVDGGHRFEAFTQLNSEEGVDGFNFISAIVRDDIETDAQAVMFQVEANTHRLKTQKAQYADALYLILCETPGMTKSDLAKKLSKTPAWVSQMLSLVGLPDDVKEKIDDGTIKPTAAVLLRRIMDRALDEKKYPNVTWEEFQHWAEKIEDMSSTEFVIEAQQYLNEEEEKEKKRDKSGDNPDPNSYIPPKPRMRKREELIQAWEMSKDGTNNFDVETLDWVLRLDPESLAQHKEEHEQKVEDRRLRKLKSEVKTACKTAAVVFTKDEDLDTLIAKLDKVKPDVAQKFRDQI